MFGKSRPNPNRNAGDIGGIYSREGIWTERLRLRPDFFQPQPEKNRRPINPRTEKRNLAPRQRHPKIKASAGRYSLPLKRKPGWNVGINSGFARGYAAINSGFARGYAVI